MVNNKQINKTEDYKKDTKKQNNKFNKKKSIPPPESSDDDDDNDKFIIDSMPMPIPSSKLDEEFIRYNKGVGNEIYTKYTTRGALRYEQLCVWIRWGRCCKV